MFTVFKVFHCLLGIYNPTGEDSHEWAAQTERALRLPPVRYVHLSQQKMFTWDSWFKRCECTQRHETVHII